MSNHQQRHLQYHLMELKRIRSRLSTDVAQAVFLQFDELIRLVEKAIADGWKLPTRDEYKGSVLDGIHGMENEGGACIPPHLEWMYPGTT